MQRSLLVAGLLVGAVGVCAAGASVSSGPASAAKTPGGTRGAAIRDIKGVEKTINTIEEQLARLGKQLAQLQSSGAPLTANQSSAVSVLFGELFADEGSVQAMTVSLRNPFTEKLVPKRKLPSTTSTTSFVVTDPASLAAAAGELAALGSKIEAAEVTASAVATGLRDAPAATDEVSAAIAALFSAYGQEYQAISAQAAAIHEEFAQVLNGSAASYATEKAGVGT